MLTLYLVICTVQLLFVTLLSLEVPETIIDVLDIYM